jgi:beta-lactamase class A
MNENMLREMTLEKRIEREIMSFSGQMGVYASDLRGRVVAINADETFETASTIKSFILAALFQKVLTGEKSLEHKLTYTQENFINGSGLLRALELGTALSVKNLATLMIVVSDNIATNMLIDYLGLEAINRTIAEMGFAGTRLHCKLGANGWARLGDTTPRDYGRLFERLAGEKLTGPQGDRQMLEIFKQQRFNSTLTYFLPPYYLDEDNYGEESPIYLASKSGSMNACRNDGGIVGTPWGRYVLAVFTKGFHDKQYHKEHESHIYGGRVSRLLFDQYLALEGRFAL